MHSKNKSLIKILLSRVNWFAACLKSNALSEYEQVAWKIV